MVCQERVKPWSDATNGMLHSVTVVSHGRDSALIGRWGVSCLGAASYGNGTRGGVAKPANTVGVFAGWIRGIHPGLRCPRSCEAARRATWRVSRGSRGGRVTDRAGASTSGIAFREVGV